MKQKLIRLSRHYAVGLGKHLKEATDATLAEALDLGSQALADGLETLDLARIHEQAVVTLGLARLSAPLRPAMTRRAGHFFAQANLPIEHTHRTAQESKAHLSHLQRALGQRTEELAVTNRQLQRGIRRRQGMETAFAESGRRHDKCLEESLKLQKQLRLLTHQFLAAHEVARTKISHELQDEIVQTLVGVNVRLLCLKAGARTNRKVLKNEIASTQRLVVKSAKSVRQYAHELHLDQPRTASERASTPKNGVRPAAA
jgi:signal transduction histidine kinase